MYTTTVNGNGTKQGVLETMLDTTERLGGFVERLMTLPSNDHHAIKKLYTRYDVVVQQLGTKDLDKLRTLAPVEYKNSLDTTIKTSSSIFAHQIDGIVGLIDSNNMKAMLLKNTIATIKSKGSKTHTIPVPPSTLLKDDYSDLFYQLLVRPGSSKFFGKLDNDIYDMVSALQNTIGQVVVQQGRLTDDTKPEVMVEIADTLEALLDNDIYSSIKHSLNGVGMVDGNHRVYRRVKVFYESQQNKANRLCTDGFYPDWFDRIGKMPVCDSLFAAHDPRVAEVLKLLSATLQQMTESPSMTVPARVNTAITDVIHLVKETLEMTVWLLQIRRLFINGYLSAKQHQLSLFK